MTDRERPNDPAAIYALVAQLEVSLREGDASSVVATLERLNQYQIYSGNEAYEKLQELQPQAIRFLYGKLPFERLLELPDRTDLSGYEILWALEPLAAEVSLDQLVALSERFTVPGPGGSPNLLRRLAEAPEPWVTEWLERRIEAALPAEREDGVELSSHLARMANFRYIRWMPDDGGLSDAVRILAQRSEARAEELTGRYLSTLPWGEDRQATRALLSGLMEKATASGRLMLQQALEQHRGPGPLRQMLLTAYAEYEPQDALIRALRDLEQVPSEEVRESYLETLGSLTEQVKASGPGHEELATTLRELNTRGWSFLSRGYLGVLIDLDLPELPYPQGVGRANRLAAWVAQFFSRLRLDHMDWLPAVPALVAGGYLFLLVLWLTLGPPPERLRKFDDTALFVWIGVALVTSRTHFAAREGLGARFRMGVAYFGSLLAFVITAIVIRL